MQKLHKEIILGVAVVLLSIFCWWFLRSVFYNENLSFGIWILTFGFFILWGIALCLVMLLIKNKAVLLGSFGLSLLLFFIFFNNEPFYYFIGLLILFFIFWLGSKAIKKEEERQVALNFWHIWKKGFKDLVTILCLLIALVYYFSPSLAGIGQIEFKIPRTYFNLFIKPIEGLVKEKLPQGIDLDSEIYKFLPKQQITELEKSLGIKVDKKDTGRDVLYKLVHYQMNNLAGPYKKFIPLGLAIGLFITLKIVSILYVGIVIMLSWLFLKILMAIKFVKIEKEQKEVETVRL